MSRSRIDPRARRLIVPAEVIDPGSGSLGGELAHYVKDVLRLRQGDAVELCDGAGRVAQATVLGLSRSAVSVAIGEVVTVPPDPPPSVTLLQAIGKGEKMDQVVRQASELGARRIVAVTSTRAVAERQGRVDRWRLIAEDAIRVSGRVYLPAIDPPASLGAVLSAPRSALAICADGAPGCRPLRDVLSQTGNPETVEVLVGPEGGWTDEERAEIEAASFVRAHLGPYTLRTETAGPAAVALVLYALGALDPSPQRSYVGAGLMRE